MKKIQYYIPFDYEMAKEWTKPFDRMALRNGNYFSPNMEGANSLLVMYMSCGLRKVMEENPNSEINISAKVVRDICDGGPGYLLRIVFGDPSERDKIEAYMKICEKEIDNAEIH